MTKTRKEHECLENTSAKGQTSFSQDLNTKATDLGISVVVLAYRSGEGLHAFVESLVQSLGENEPSWEIVLVGNHFVDDGDPTPCIVSEIAQSHPRIRAVTRVKEGMMGWDMKTGLESATGRTIAVIDGDGQMPLEDVIHVYNKLKDEDLDLVKTFRTQRGDGLYRKTISVAYNIIFNILFPGLNCKDVNSKPKIMTREVYNRMHLNSNGWFIDAEIMIQAREMNLKVGEIPTVFHQINYRPSFVKLRSIWEFSVNLIWYRLFNKSKI
jgi:glycosyltransferase involved in cell wall biosynthesis